MKRIICLYGGPCSGKSTVCAEIYADLKKKDFNCEMNREYIKEWVWEKRQVKEGDQSYFFAKQARKERLYIQQNVDFIITDSPLILTHFYGMLNDPMERDYNTSLIMLEHHHGFCRKYGYKTDHYFIDRQHDTYNESGRFQTKEQAIALDREIKKLLFDTGISFTEVSKASEIYNLYPKVTNDTAGT